MSLIFTGDEYADGGDFIARTLATHNITANFFFTGRFYRNPSFAGVIRKLLAAGHYLGAHSDAHLLYCDWSNRDSLLVTRAQFVADIKQNYRSMHTWGINRKDAGFFLPPYEWYNDSIAAWTRDEGLQLINFTPGTSSNADYTTPDMKNYRSSENILQNILQYEKTAHPGLNGFLLLIHAGTHPDRRDKFYLLLPRLITALKKQGYRFVRVDHLLQ